MSRSRLPFESASALLARRWRGGSDVGGDDWLCPDAVQALLMPLSPALAPVLHVVLRDGVSARSVPSRLPRRFGGEELPIKPLRAPPAKAQAGPPRLTLQRTNEIGTATALVRDRLNGERYYLLTCAHVVAPDAAARFGDAVTIGDRAGAMTAELREWQPMIGEGCPPSRLDAALIELDAGTLQALRQRGTAWLPRSLCDSVQAQQPVALQRVDGALDGALAVHWSGEVGAGSAEFSNYFLEDAIGYVTGSPTAAGDSGAALWTAGDALLGMHIGAVDAAGALGANAVMARVRPALDWYCIKPFTRNDPATLGADDWPPLPEGVAGAGAGATMAAAAPASGSDLDVLAQTLWGEARGEGKAGMEAVAAVILNRWRTRYRGQTSVAGVCRDPFQFSCWNARDPNRPAMQRMLVNPDADFKLALEVSGQALAGGIPDPTAGARHYVSTSLRDRPFWLDHKRPCAVIGRHEFYNDIA